MRHPWVALIVLVLVLAAAPAVADDGSVGGTPGNVRIVGSNDIRMEAETVQAVIYSRFAEYVVDFRFVNSGEPQEVRLGFPFALDDQSPDDPPVALAGFQAWHDGRRLAVTTSTGVDGPVQTGWFEHETTFPAGESHVRVRYSTRPSMSLGAPDQADESRPDRFSRFEYTASAWYPYTLHTGAGWADTIGRAVIRYSIAEDVQGWGFGTVNWDGWMATRPSGYATPDASTFQWVFDDFEPVADPQTGESAYDINLAYALPIDTSRTSADDPAEPYRKVGASSVSPVEVYDWLKYPAAAACDGDPSTYWLSSPGDVDGAHLTLATRRSLRVRELRIVAGAARLPSEFRDHGRPATLRAEFSDGSQRVLELTDEPAVQRFPVDVQTDWVRLTVEDVHGEKAPDVAIAEVELGTAPSPEFEEFDTVLGSGPGPTEAIIESVAVEPGVSAEHSVAPEATTRSNDLIPALAAILAAWVLAPAAVIAMLVRRRRAG